MGGAQSSILFFGLSIIYRPSIWGYHLGTMAEGTPPSNYSKTAGEISDAKL